SPGPYTFTVTAGSLPAGVPLNAGSGVLAGSPTATGSFAFTVTATDTAGCTGTRAYTLIVRPVARPDTYTGGVGNTHLGVGAPPPTTPHVFVAGSLLDNDAGAGPLTATLATPPANGGVVVNPNGTFIYTPNVGFAGPTDSFTYTASDGGGTGATALVTIHLSGVVWYHNSDSPVIPDGRSHAPFQNIVGLPIFPPADTGAIRFVHSSSLNYLGALLHDGQVLHGQGVPFTLNGLTIPAGAPPVIIGPVTLAHDNTLRGLSLGQAFLPAAVTATNFGTLTVRPTPIPPIPTTPD